MVRRRAIHELAAPSAPTAALSRAASDVQERFRDVIHKFDAVVAGASRMVATAKELQIPLVVTEQYPKGLGHTVEQLDVSCAAATGGGLVCPPLRLSRDF